MYKYRVVNGLICSIKDSTDKAIMVEPLSSPTANEVNLVTGDIILVNTNTLGIRNDIFGIMHNPINSTHWGVSSYAWELEIFKGISFIGEYNMQVNPKADNMKRMCYYGGLKMFPLRIQDNIIVFWHETTSVDFLHRYIFTHYLIAPEEEYVYIPQIEVAGVVHVSVYKLDLSFLRKLHSKVLVAFPKTLDYVTSTDTQKKVAKVRKIAHNTVKKYYEYGDRLC